MRDVEKHIQSDNMGLDEIPAFESRLPALKRTTSTKDVDANTDQGWYFKNPTQFPLRIPRK
jgi:hypothetical protein